MKIGKYMTATPVGIKPREVYIVSDRHGGRLAFVEWYPRWRQYVVDPQEGAVFSADCLRDLATFCEERAP